MYNLKENEKELILLINFFNGRVQKLMKGGKLSPMHLEVSKACDHLIGQLNAHASLRARVILRREEFMILTKESILCPNCKSNFLLNQVDFEINEKGWKVNYYKCSECNQNFTLDKPNNLWDMVDYMTDLIKITEEGLKKEKLEEKRLKSEKIIIQTRKSLDKLKNIIAAFDREFENMQIRDLHMDEVIKNFKTYLLKEKVETELFIN